MLGGEYCDGRSGRRLAVTAGQQMVDVGSRQLGRFIDIFVLLCLILHKDFMGAKTLHAGYFIRAGCAREEVGHLGSLFNGCRRFCDRLCLCWSQVSWVVELKLFWGKNRQPLAFLVGRNLFLTLVVLGFGERLILELVVVCVFALILLWDSFCGLLVIPGKMLVKVMPKRWLLYNKKEDQNSISNSFCRIFQHEKRTG